MKRLIDCIRIGGILLVLLVQTLEIIGQKPVLWKMSSLVREAAIETYGNKTKALFRNETNDRTALIMALVRATSENTLKEYGCEIIAKFGDIYVTTIPLNNLAQMSNSEEVKRIEAGHFASVHMDTTRFLVNAEAVNSGMNLPHEYTGRGVVIGVQDIGFDLTHPTFYTIDMRRNRIVAMWDQLSTDTLGSKLCVGRDYVGQKALEIIGCSRDGQTEAHGTHTAGIAAGSGVEAPGVVSNYRGMAPEADICLVANVTSDNARFIDSTLYYKYTYATDLLGFKYIFDYARSVSKPCVINFSEGSPQGFTNEEMLINEVLDSLTGPGRIIVASAGNEGEFINHLHKERGRESAGNFLLGNPDKVFLTALSADEFVFRVAVYNDKHNPTIFTIPTERIVASTDSLLCDTLLVGGRQYIVKVSAYPSCYDLSRTAYDFIISSSPSLGHDVFASFEIVGTDADVEVYRMRGYLTPRDLNPALVDGDVSQSVHTPASAPSVIAVGATAYRTEFVNYLGERKIYNSGKDGRLTYYSSTGPSRDGRLKPEVVAPGHNIISAYSSHFVMNPANNGAPIASDVRHFQLNNRTYAWNANSGTSMSTPIVAGAIALWLEAYPRLTAADCRAIFARTSTHNDNVANYPNNRYGYGQIDVLAGLKEVLKLSAAGIEEVESKSSSSNAIYLLDGRLVGLDAENLSPGIYIRAHRKFIKR